MSHGTRRLLLAESILLLAPPTVLVALGFAWSARFLVASVRRWQLAGSDHLDVGGNRRRLGGHLGGLVAADSSSGACNACNSASMPRALLGACR
jgi:hypothetical protein